MGSAYTPGLTVSADTVVRRVRRLPIKGDVLVKVGDAVKPDTVVARAMLPGPLQTVRLAEKLGIEPKEAPGMCLVKPEDHVEKGHLLAKTKGLFGKLFIQEVHCDYSGTIESVSEITGNVLVREPSVPVELTAYVAGTIVDVLPGEGAVVETRGAMIQGIFGIGGERRGTIRVAVDSGETVLDAQHIQPDDKGKILVGGAGVTAAGLKKANEIGVAGVVVGAVKDSDLTELLGYEIGVAITGQEPVTTTLLCTEGFGELRMAERTFQLLKSIEGREASMDGATQIRAGVIRPEVIAPIEHAAGDVPRPHAGQVLTVGTPIRVIREPYFGKLGTVTQLPPQLQVVESETEVRVLIAKLDDGQEVTVPRANVEIIATS